MGILPKRPKTDAPKHVPDEIAQNYKEAMDSLRRQNWTSAGMMFRKVLQRATSAIAPEGFENKKTRLLKRINALAKQQKITPSMADLARLIKDEGDDATHNEEEEFTKEEAHQMQRFTELFLIYTITLPKRVEQAKAEAKESGGDAPSSS